MMLRAWQVVFLVGLVFSTGEAGKPPKIADTAEQEEDVSPVEDRADPEDVNVKESTGLHLPLKAAVRLATLRAEEAQAKDTAKRNAANAAAAAKRAAATAKAAAALQAGMLKAAAAHAKAMERASNLTDLAEQAEARQHGIAHRVKKAAAACAAAAQAAEDQAKHRKKCLARQASNGTAGCHGHHSHGRVPRTASGPSRQGGRMLSDAELMAKAKRHCAEKDAIKRRLRAEKNDKAKDEAEDKDEEEKKAGAETKDKVRQSRGHKHNSTWSQEEVSKERRARREARLAAKLARDKERNATAGKTSDCKKSK